MSNEAWREESDPERLIVYLQKQGHDLSRRKLRLLGVACCRRIWDRLTRPKRRAIEAAERLAEGRGLTDAERARFAALRGTLPSYLKNCRMHRVFSECATDLAWKEAKCREEFDCIRDYERKEQCRLVVDVFGDLFYGVVVEPAWLTPTVTTLARVIYEEGRFDDLPILGDALEDAGCTDAVILSHCRGPGPHVRGCWLLDRLLRKDAVLY